MRKLLESARKDAEQEVKAIQDKLDSERVTASSTIAQLTEEIEKATETSNEWKNKHAALGVQLSTQLQQVQADCEAKAKELAEAHERVVELEAEGGKKAQAEKEILAKELEELRAQYDKVMAQKQDLTNAQTVCAHD